MNRVIFAIALAAAFSWQAAVAQTTAPANTAAAPKTKEATVISEDEAKVIAEKRVPGKAIDVAIEKKRGVNRYVVEVRPAAGGKELDVIIDMTSGKVIGVEK